jgi:hypothetical protein
MRMRFTRHREDIANYLFWLALLALPACSFERSGAFEPGPGNPLPHTTLLFCDIPVPLGRHCATATDLATGIRLNEAAVALSSGDSGGNIGLDDSPEALARCNGQPEAVVFRGPFPIGNPLCVNGMAIGIAEPKPPYASADAACIAQCETLFGAFDFETGAWYPDLPVAPSTAQFCAGVAHASTNLPQGDNIGFPGGCTVGGIARPDFADPRKVAEPVVWTDRINVAATGNDLERTAPTDGTFSAGAASTAWFTGGDGFVEFGAGENNLGHIIGLSESPLACYSTGCNDLDPGKDDISFGILLDANNFFYAWEQGQIKTNVPGADPTGILGGYDASVRFRVKLVDRGNGTARVLYSRIIGTCAPGTPCTESIFDPNSIARYPLRVDASLLQQNAKLTNVRVVHIVPKHP